MTIGRLIFPQRAIIRQIRTKTIADAGNYDTIAREVKRVDADGDGIGEPLRAESAEIVVPAQFATRNFERGYQAEHGRVPETPNFELTFHFRDLAALSLVETSGAAKGRSKIVPGDRLVRLEDADGNMIHDFPNPPGMYLVSVRPSGFLGRTRNLLVCTFSDRRQDAPEPSLSQL